MPEAAAMTPVGCAGLRPAIEAVNPVAVNPVVSVVACWGYGWRGWGLYPGGLLRGVYPAPPAVYPAPVYAPAPANATPGRGWIDGSWRACWGLACSSPCGERLPDPWATWSPGDAFF